MKKSIMYTLGIAALFCAACVDDSTGSGGEVNALLEKYNNPNSGGGAPSVTTYTVKFNANGGTGAVHADIPVSANNSITLPDKGTLSNGDLVFNGWNTQSDGTGTNHPAGTAYTVTGNITLYATWKEASTGGGDEPGLVLAEGEAWVSGDSGYIFTSSNRIIKIRNILDSWWYADTGIYLTTGNNIMINSIPWTYSVSGNELNISICSCIFTKTSGVEPKTGFPSFTDTRDNNSYRLVRLGTQVWFSSNVNYNVAGSVCYDNSADSCAKYGRLYTWADAKSACPAGWHLPSDAEWTTLVMYAGGEATAGKKLKAKSGWNNNGNGTDDYGFAALPGGSGLSVGGSYGVGSRGYWWSSTEDVAYYYAWSRDMDYGSEYVRRGSGDKTDLFSVRCVQD